MNKRWMPVILVGLAIALVVALFSPFASSHPDGLERVAEDKEFGHKAEDPSYQIIPDYAFPGIENERVATILSGIVGIAIVGAIGFGVMYGMKMLAKKPSTPQASSTNGPGAG